jgi:hypothetical protein
MVLMSYKGKTILTVRGPETKASPADFPADAEWLGITFKFGTFMPDFSPGRVLDRNDVNLPVASSKSFWLYGSTWEIPDYENADTFVNRLVHGGLLVRDPLVDDVMQDCPPDLSLSASGANASVSTLWLFSRTCFLSTLTVFAPIVFLPTAFVFIVAFF